MNIGCYWLFLPALLAFSLWPAAPILANGWEWHSVPREALIAELEGERPDAKRYAIRALGLRRDRSVAPRLVEFASSPDETTELRKTALQALASIKDEATVSPITRLLQTATGAEIRGGAAAALGNIGGEAALAAILDAFRGEQSLLARVEIIEALGQFNDPRAVTALAKVLSTEKSVNTRRRAAIALGRTGHRSAAKPLIDALAPEINRSFIGDLIDALGQIGDPAAREPLTALMKQTDNSLFQVRAIIALGSLDHGGTPAALVELLDDPRPAIRYHAIRGLAKQADPATRPALVKAYRAMTGDGAAGGEAVSVDTLYRITMRYEIVRALTSVDPIGGAEVLRHASQRKTYPRDSAISLRLNEAAYELRRAAVWGLGYTDADASVQLLLASAIEDQDFRIRSVAARSLGVLGRRDAVPAIARRLEDEKAEVRWQAALVLGRLGDPAPIKMLINAAADSHPQVRREAVIALGYLNATEAMSLLGHLATEDPSEKVRAAASRAKDLIKQ